MSGLLAPVDNKNVPQSLRQRMAIAMLMQKRQYPKTFGEGLSSIGDDIGQAMMLRGIYGDAAAAEKAGMTAEERIRGGGGPIAEAPGSVVAPASSASAPAAPAPPPLASQIQPVAAQQFPVAGLRSAQPLSADEQESGTGLPGSAPYRMPSPEAVQDGRNALPPLPAGVPPVPTQPRPLPPAAARPPLPAEATPPAVAGPAAPFAGNDSRFNASFPNRARTTLQPTPPPVLASGGDDITTMGPASVATSDQIGAGRNALAAALAQRQQAALPPTPTTPPPPAAPPVEAPPPPQQAIRAAPPAVPLQAAPPPQTGPGPGYVLKLPPTPIPPEVKTLKMQQIEDEVRRTPPAYRETVAERLKLQYEEEQKRLAQKNVIYQDEMKSLHEMKKLQEEQRGKADKDIREAEEHKTKIPSPGPTATAGDDRLLGTPQSPQRTGQPVVDPVPPGAIPAEWAKEQQKKIIADAAALENARPELRETLDLIAKVRAHPAKEASLGTFGGLARLTATGQGFAKLDEQLKGKNLVAAYQKIKGTGPVGEREGENIAKAQSALNTATSQKDYDDALATLENTLRGATERAERKMRQPVTAYQRTPNDPVAPDIGQIDATWSDGKVRQYIGGDPHDKEKSWKIVR
jgi:hypothetical protein